MAYDLGVKATNSGCDTTVHLADHGAPGGRSLLQGIVTSQNDIR